LLQTFGQIGNYYSQITNVGAAFTKFRPYLLCEHNDAMHSRYSCDGCVWLLIGSLDFSQ